MDEKNVFFHVGLPKTGTTYLQKVVFNGFEQIHFANVNMLFGEPLDKARDKPFLYSNERLSGSFLPEASLAHFEIVLDNINRFFGDVGIIIGFRPQYEYVLSLYIQSLKAGKCLTLEEFYNQGISGSALISDEELNWEKKLKLVEEKFSRVFVYTNQWLKEDLTGFLESLSRFMRVETMKPKEEIIHVQKNVSINKKWAVCMLLKLNRINRCLENTPLLPSLHNRVFVKFGLTPRKIVEKRLVGLGKKRFVLPHNMKMHLVEKFQSDWEYVESRVFR